MDKKTEAQIILIAVHATFMVQKLEELVGEWPDDCDADSVVPLSDVVQIIDEFRSKAYPCKKA